MFIVRTQHLEMLKKVLIKSNKELIKKKGNEKVISDNTKAISMIDEEYLKITRD